MKNQDAWAVMLRGRQVETFYTPAGRYTPAQMKKSLIDSGFPASIKVKKANPLMPIGASTIEEVIEMYHPRATAYWIAPNGLVGFITIKIITTRHPTTGKAFPRRVRSVIWYSYDGASGVYVPVGTSRSTGQAMQKCSLRR